MFCHNFLEYKLLQDNNSAYNVTKNNKKLQDMNVNICFEI